MWLKDKTAMIRLEKEIIIIIVSNTVKASPPFKYGVSRPPLRILLLPLYYTIYLSNIKNIRSLLLKMILISYLYIKKPPVWWMVNILFL